MVVTSEKQQLQNIDPEKYYPFYNESQYFDTEHQLKHSSSINKWRRAALVVAVLSTIASFAIGITETVVSRIEDSSAAFALAFTAILDALTSVVVCWRFFKEVDIYSQRKEHIACIIFGIIITISAMGTAAKCVFGLIDRDMPDLSDSGERVMLISSIVSASLCFVIFIVNMIIGKNLASWVILSDAIDSLVGGIIATSMVITSEVTKSNHRYWYLDEVVGLITSILLVVYGLWLTLKHCHKLEYADMKSSITSACGQKCYRC